MAITFLPVSDNSDSSVTAKARVTAKILNYTNLDESDYYYGDYPYASVLASYKVEQDITLGDIVQIQSSIFPKHSYASANNIMVTTAIGVATLTIAAI